ncbi:MAG TPA: FadR/GntR family transcriptional regulator [Aggregatilineales bacterium]|nr:FadR/GntR family transcriptional regulator [Aggregatilineales bacterium]
MNTSGFEPVRKRTSVAEEISRRILSLLRDRELRPGDKLPPERDLATMLEVSRPSLREALRALALMNIIEIRQGDGTYVSSLEPDQLLEHLDFVFHLDESTLLQLFEARKIVEVGCVELAAKNIDAEALKKLETILTLCENTVGDADGFMQADLALHETLIEASQNPMLIRFMSSISQLGMASRQITTTSAAVRTASLEDHRAIVAAIQAHDPDAASAAMLHHLNTVEQSLRTAIASSDDKR